MVERLLMQGRKKKENIERLKNQKRMQEESACVGKPEIIGIPSAPKNRKPLYHQDRLNLELSQKETRRQQLISKYTEERKQKEEKELQKSYVDLGGTKLRQRTEGKSLSIYKFEQDWERQVNKYFNNLEDREKQRHEQESVGLTFTP